MTTTVIALHDRARIELVLRRDPAVNIYALGDLDDFFWPHTIWYGAARKGQVEAIALLWVGAALPTLLLFDASEPAVDLARALRPLLPARFYAHLHPDLVPVLATELSFASRGLHDKMALTDPAAALEVDTAGAVPLGAGDLDELQALYAASYPGNWFDPRMLETGQYVGLRREGRLVSVAGIHVYSPTYRVAALGNITTHPGHRANGLGRIATAACCQALLRSVDVVGLNVKADNQAAIRCYRRLGFERVAEYEEGMCEPRP